MGTIRAAASLSSSIYCIFSFLSSNNVRTTLYTFLKNKKRKMYLKKEETEMDRESRLKWKYPI